MNTNNKFIGAGATESKDRIAALLLMPTSRANPFAAVGGTRHDTRSGVLAHIELSTAAFESPSLERRNYPELSCIGGLHPAGIPECMPFQFRPAPVLADTLLVKQGGEARESTLESRRVRRNSVSLIINRTLAAGRIQFTSEWRNWFTQRTAGRIVCYNEIGQAIKPLNHAGSIPASLTNFTELHCHSGQTRAVYGGTRSAITGQTQQPNAVQIAIT